MPGIASAQWVVTLPVRSSTVRKSQPSGGRALRTSMQTGQPIGCCPANQGCQNPQWAQAYWISGMIAPSR